MKYSDIEKSLASGGSKLGCFLVKKGLISEEQLLKVLMIQDLKKRKGISIPLGAIIKAEKMINEKDFQSALLLYYSEKFMEHGERNTDFFTNISSLYGNQNKKTSTSSVSLSETSKVTLRIMLKRRQNERYLVLEKIGLYETRKTEIAANIIKKYHEILKKIEKEINELETDLGKYS